MACPVESIYKLVEIFHTLGPPHFPNALPTKWHFDFPTARESLLSAPSQGRWERTKSRKAYTLAHSRIAKSLHLKQKFHPPQTKKKPRETDEKPTKRPFVERKAGTFRAKSGVFSKENLRSDDWKPTIWRQKTYDQAAKSLLFNPSEAGILPVSASSFFLSCKEPVSKNSPSIDIRQP